MDGTEVLTRFSSSGVRMSIRAGEHPASQAYSTPRRNPLSIPTSENVAA